MEIDKEELVKTDRMYRKSRSGRKSIPQIDHETKLHNNKTSENVTNFYPLTKRTILYQLESRLIKIHLMQMYDTTPQPINQNLY